MTNSTYIHRAIPSHRTSNPGSPCEADASLPVSVSRVADRGASADGILQAAMSTGDPDQITLALESQGEFGSSDVVAEARQTRHQLRKSVKKAQRQQRKAEEAGSLVHTLRDAPDEESLEGAIKAAEPHRGVSPALDEALEAAQGRLERMRQDIIHV